MSISVEPNNNPRGQRLAKEIPTTPLASDDKNKVSLSGVTPGDSHISNYLETYFKQVRDVTQRQGSIERTQETIAADEHFYNRLSWDLRMIALEKFDLLEEFQRHEVPAAFDESLSYRIGLYEQSVKEDELKQLLLECALNEKKQKELLDEIAERHHKSLLDDWITINNHKIELNLLALQQKIELNLEYLAEVETVLEDLLQNDPHLSQALQTNIQDTLREVKETKEFISNANLDGLRRACRNDDGSINVDAQRHFESVASQINEKLERTRTKVDNTLREMEKELKHRVDNKLNVNNEYLMKSCEKLRDLKEKLRENVAQVDRNVGAAMEGMEQQLNEIKGVPRSAAKKIFQNLDQLSPLAENNRTVRKFHKQINTEVRQLLTVVSQPQEYQRQLKKIVNSIDDFVSENISTQSNNDDVYEAISIVTKLKQDIPVVSTTPTRPTASFASSPQEPQESPAATSSQQTRTEASLPYEQSTETPISREAHTGSTEVDPVLETSDCSEEATEENVEKEVEEQETQEAAEETSEDKVETEQVVEFPEEVSVMIKKTIAEFEEVQEDYSDSDLSLLLDYLDDFSNANTGETDTHHLKEKLITELYDQIEELSDEELKDELKSLMAITIPDTTPSRSFGI